MIFFRIQARTAATLVPKVGGESTAFSIAAVTTEASAVASLANVDVPPVGPARVVKTVRAGIGNS